MNCAIIFPLTSTAKKCVKRRKSVQTKSELSAHGEDPENQDDVNPNQLTLIKWLVTIPDITSTTPIHAETPTPPAKNKRRQNVNTPSPIHVKTFYEQKAYAFDFSTGCKCTT